MLESVCYTRTLDKYIREKYSTDKSLGINPPQMYFGAVDGMLRIYPARQSQTCGDYDPRTVRVLPL